MVKMLLKIEGIEVNKENYGGDTPLFFAARARHSRVVNLLLGTEEIKAIGWNGWRPIAVPG